ncbi:MAG TPA: hypothetical protein VM597_22585 [Gemmataceae bacterium]|jgi:hypothetical protein|nr:hypothetical protein [Gemmataceae bacterium]
MAGEWATADLPKLLELAAGRVTDRQLRLFNCWCGHVVEPYLKDRRSRMALRLAEFLADQPDRDVPPKAAIGAARQAVRDLESRAGVVPDGTDAVERPHAVAAQVAQFALGNDLPNGGILSVALFTSHVVEWANGTTIDGGAFGPLLTGTDWVRALHARRAAAAFRDIVPDPGRPVRLDPRWRTVDVVGVARAIHADQSFHLLPILADALVDAGCDDDLLLDHCRSADPHVRGCWLISALLGRA